MGNLATIRYVTEHYPRLQGLRLVPLGVLFLLSAAWRLHWFSLPTSVFHPRDWFLVGFVIAIAASFAIRTRYERTLGHIEPLPGRSGFVTLMSIFVGFMLLGWIQQSFRWPVSIPIPVVFVALCLAYTGVVHGRLRKHYILVAVAALAVAGINILGVPDAIRPVFFDLMVGGGLILAGIGDDFVLRHTLQPPASETHAGTV